MFHHFSLQFRNIFHLPLPHKNYVNFFTKNVIVANANVLLRKMKKCHHFASEPPSESKIFLKGRRILSPLDPSPGRRSIGAPIRKSWIRHCCMYKSAHSYRKPHNQSACQWDLEPHAHHCEIPLYSVN